VAYSVMDRKKFAMPAADNTPPVRHAPATT